MGRGIYENGGGLYGMGPRGSEQPQGFTTVRALPQSTTGRPLSHAQTHAHMPMVRNSRNKVLTKTYFLCPSIAFSMNRQSCCLERLHLSLRGTWLVVNQPAFIIMQVSPVRRSRLFLRPMQPGLDWYRGGCLVGWPANVLSRRPEYGNGP